MTPRQRDMLTKYDADAKTGNKMAAVIALALRIKIHRECKECSGHALGGDTEPHACPRCVADGVVDREGREIGRRNP